MDLHAYDPEDPYGHYPTSLLHVHIGKTPIFNQMQQANNHNKQQQYTLSNTDIDCNISFGQV